LKRSVLAIIIVSLVLIIDQGSKIWVKLNMAIGDAFNMFGEGQNWAEIYFVENPGMAFGLDWGGGKIILSLFRMVAIGFIIYYLRRLIKEKRSFGAIVAISLILAGASGNLIDNMFYGLMFTESTSLHVAELTSFGSGYAGFLMGDVVDMLHFPMVEGHYPQFLGGGRFEFFAPIFNIADSSVFCGVVTVMIFYKQFSGDFSFKKKEDKTEENETTEIQDAPNIQDEMV
jgi:signal peptidase II